MPARRMSGRGASWIEKRPPGGGIDHFRAVRNAADVDGVIRVIRAAHIAPAASLVRIPQPATLLIVIILLIPAPALMLRGLAQQVACARADGRARQRLVAAS